DPEAKREFDDKFLYQRDLAMARKIEELLRQPGPHFIAVGSLHLVGPKSIVEQLKARGYRVQQI
ncbi:MAG TPA: TraB/GumN family protein, partial [Burkholderiaceae bacterium]|nr:TraB/GumN family protein [Burkholderiaceae bacterium]